VPDVDALDLTGSRDSWRAWMTDALGFVCRFVACHYPAAEVALLTGSQSRGEATIGSDYDVVLLFGSLPDGAWREMVLFEGRHVEVFAHDLGTIAYFCREVDRPSGVPALPAMVAEGVSALPKSSSLLDAAREIACEVLRLGPFPLGDDAIRMRRYAITDLAAALQSDRDKGVLIATAAALYSALADFALRAAGNWSALGKAFPRALTAMDAALAEQFEAAFTTLFAAGDVGPVQALVDAVLAPYGGRLREGFRRGAPAAWRDKY
jgi:hypothetical protein